MERAEPSGEVSLGTEERQDSQIMGFQSSSIRKTYSDYLALKSHHGV